HTSVVVWSTAGGATWQRHAVDAVGTDPDPLSAVTTLAVVGRRLVVGARLGDRLVLATSDDGVTWSELAPPSGVPTGPRATVAVGVAGDRLVLGATGDAANTRVWWRAAGG